MSAALAPYRVDSLINITAYFSLGTVCLATWHPCT